MKIEDNILELIARNIIWKYPLQYTTDTSRMRLHECTRKCCFTCVNFTADVNILYSVSTGMNILYRVHYLVCLLQRYVQNKPIVVFLLWARTKIMSLSKVTKSCLIWEIGKIYIYKQQQNIQAIIYSRLLKDSNWKPRFTINVQHYINESIYIYFLFLIIIFIYIIIIIIF